MDDCDYCEQTLRDYYTDLWYGGAVDRSDPEVYFWHQYTSVVVAHDELDCVVNCEYFSNIPFYDDVDCPTYMLNVDVRFANPDDAETNVEIDQYEGYESARLCKIAHDYFLVNFSCRAYDHRKVCEYPIYKLIDGFEQKHFVGHVYTRKRDLNGDVHHALLNHPTTDE